MSKFMTNLIVVAIAAFGVTKASMALAGGYIYEYYYYSNSNYNWPVGRTTLLCDGSSYTEGKVTQYRLLRSKEPCGGMN